MSTKNDSFKLLAEVEAELRAEMAEADAQWRAEQEQYEAESAQARAEFDRKRYLDSLDLAQEMLDARRPAENARTAKMMDNWSRANGIR